MSRRSTYKFRLFIAGDTQNSTQALANLRVLCGLLKPAGHEIEIVDVLREPMRALADGVLLTPTLVILSPPPVRKIIGTLNQTEVVLHALKVEPDNS